jgi:hypothetical protein
MQRPHVSDPWYIGTRVPPYDTATRSSSFPDYRASCANRACSANASWPAWPDSPVDGGTHQSDKTSPASTRCRDCSASPAYVPDQTYSLTGPHQPASNRQQRIRS